MTTINAECKFNKKTNRKRPVRVFSAGLFIQLSLKRAMVSSQFAIK